MPDGDVFDRNVKARWQTASRRFFAGGETTSVLPAVLRALADELRTEGCRGIEQIVDLLIRFLRCPSGDLHFRSEFWQLDRIRKEHLSPATEMAIASGKSILIDCERSELAAMDDAALRMHFGSQILAYRAIGLMCPASAVVQAVVVSGLINMRELPDRQFEMRRLIANAPETQRLVKQVFDAPDGSTVKRPRTSSTKPSQAAILEIALTT